MTGEVYFHAAVVYANTITICIYSCFMRLLMCITLDDHV